MQVASAPNTGEQRVRDLGPTFDRLPHGPTRKVTHPSRRCYVVDAAEWGSAVDQFVWHQDAGGDRSHGDAVLEQHGRCEIQAWERGTGV